MIAPPRRSKLPRPFLLLAGLWLLALAAPLSAQERELAWPDITVTAHLDADGRLHVRERQRLRMSGDWNGGERRFDVRLGQDLTLERIVRIDSLTGQPHAMVEDSLDIVDGFGWQEGHTLRWRSRLPTDPLFDETQLTYELTYTYESMLIPQRDGTYRFDHDFAFADRSGDIEHFALTLTLDSAWHAPADFSGQYEATAMAPGYGFVVRIPLTRISATLPASVRFGAPASARYGALAALLVGLVLLFGWRFWSDHRIGKLAPLQHAATVTPEFLATHVLAFLPEVVGAAWDDSTSSAEVAATLARMVQDGALVSRVESHRILIFTRHVLHLELKTTRNALKEHERALIDALFYSGKTTTNTDAVRQRYRTSGFNPASILEPRLARLVQQMVPGAADSTPTERASRWPTVLTLVLAFALVVLGARTSAEDAVTALAALAASLPPFLLARGAANEWRRRVARLWIPGVPMVLLPFGTAAAFAWMLVFNEASRVSALLLIGLVVWQLVLAYNICARAAATQSPDLIAQRKRLAAARAFFAAELRKASPALRDEWYPYMLAFGLGSRVDRWFKAFGGVSSTVGSSTGRFVQSDTGISGSSSSSSFGGSGFSGFGGGGGFSGAGGGAAFGAAIGSMAASVPSPSSSSSSGGSSSGGSSSGGGGGGGW